MAKIDTVAFTEKGVLSQKVKSKVKDHEVKNLQKILTDANYETSGKDTVFVKDYEDRNGQKFYAVLEFKTTNLHPDNAKKPKSKKVAEELDFSIE